MHQQHRETSAANYHVHRAQVPLEPVCLKVTKELDLCKLV